MARFHRALLPVLLGAGALVLAAWYGAHPPGRGPAAAQLAGDTPPGVRFVTVALGGFRGIAADILWVRASDLQDQGRFFEVAQLSDWITRLEPRYPEVWIYHAWNLAYNITAVIPDPVDRWHWVMNGVRLLRDEAIPANRECPKLYWELGWIYLDKVGGRWDEASLYYRIGWASTMGDLLGGGMINHTALAAHPEVAAHWSRAGLDPKAMREVDDLYGPLDWRLPESHALYWGYKGHPFQNPDERWCDRLVWTALLGEMKGGRLMFSPSKHLYLQGPRLDLAVKGMRRCETEKLLDSPLTGLVATRFLHDAVLYLFAFGRLAEAEEARSILIRLTGGKDSGMSLESLVAHEAERGEMLSPVSKREQIVGWLARGERFRRLKVSDYGDGFERLARLHWEAMRRLDPAFPDWEGLLRDAHAQAVRDLPPDVLD